MEEPLLSWFLLVGRVCLSLVYLVSGLHKGLYFQQAVDEFHAARIPLTRAAVVVTVGLHTLAALCLMAGIFVQESALTLAVFTLVATYRVHDFWNLQGPERLLQSRFALAHLAIVGGLLLLAAAGPGTLVLFE